MKFKSISGKDIQINLDSGHSGTVFADDWCDLHPMFHREAIAQGVITDNMSAESIAAASVVAGDGGIPKMKLIKEAIEAMILDANKSDFTQSGHPNLKRLGERVGFGVERTDMEAMWAEITADDDPE